MPGLSDHHVILWTPGVPEGLWRVTLLLAGTDYRRIHGTLITSSACHPPSQQPAAAPPPPERSLAELNMHYSYATEV